MQRTTFLEVVGLNTHYVVPTFLAIWSECRILNTINQIYGYGDLEGCHLPTLAGQSLAAGPLQLPATLHVDITTRQKPGHYISTSANAVPTGRVSRVLADEAVMSEPGFFPDLTLTCTQYHVCPLAMSAKLPRNLGSILPSKEFIIEKWNIFIWSCEFLSKVPLLLLTSLPIFPSFRGR